MVLTNYLVTHRLSCMLKLTLTLAIKLHYRKGGGRVGGSGDHNFLLQISSSWVKIKLHSDNQLPRLWLWWWVPLNYVVTPNSYWVEVGL